MNCNSLFEILKLIRAFKPKQKFDHTSKVDITFFFLSSAVLTSTKGISSIKSEMGILIIYSYSVIDVRTWWFGWVQEIQEAIFKRKHSSSALLLVCNKHSWDTIAAKTKSYKAQKKFCLFRDFWHNKNFTIFDT